MWLPVIIAFSVLTYLASAIGLLGGVSARVPFWPTVMAQGASSFVNRVSPSNVGGMALNVRFLQKSGVEPAAGVAAVGVNSLAGALVHTALLVIFFAWAGRSPGKAPPSRDGRRNMYRRVRVVDTLLVLVRAPGWPSYRRALRCSNRRAVGASACQCDP
jgi:hypothetical protein